MSCVISTGSLVETFGILKTTGWMTGIVYSLSPVHPQNWMKSGVIWYLEVTSPQPHWLKTLKLWRIVEFQSLLHII